MAAGSVRTRRGSAHLQLIVHARTVAVKRPCRSSRRSTEPAIERFGKADKAWRVPMAWRRAGSGGGGGKRLLVLRTFLWGSAWQCTAERGGALLFR